MKRFVSVLGVLLTLGWSGLAFAQATAITTACPTPSFICAFSAAEALSFQTQKSVGNPGQPDVYVGYIDFESSGVTLTGLKNVNGTVGAIGSPDLSGTCAPGASGQPALITFTDKSQIAFVTDAAGTELQFILSQDINSTTKGTNTITNSVRVGVCRKQ
jgi:hypothetical protein